MIGYFAEYIGQKEKKKKTEDKRRHGDDPIHHWSITGEQ